MQADTYATEPTPMSQPEPASNAPALIAAGGEVVHLPLEAIVADDTAYMFRLHLRVTPLRVNLQHEGQQLPVIVRPMPIYGDGPPRYQLISGFRRLTAIRELGWPTIAAIIRHDLADDEAAFRASVVENVARRSYSDIDRAMVIRSYKDRGFKGADIARALGLDNRNRKILGSLLTMPEAIQEAVDDPAHPFSTKHAVLLWRQRQKYPTIRVRTWIDLVQSENLSAEAMVRRIQERHKTDADIPSAFRSVFQERGTDLEAGQVWFAPTRVDLKTMTDEDRRRLRDELEQLLKAVDDA